MATERLPGRWPCYAAVRFTSSCYEVDGAPQGSKGYIVDVYANAYEVEVSDSGGRTIFLGAVRDSDLELLDET